MTVAEVADYLRIKERKVYDLLAQKRIPCTRVTGKWLFPKQQIDYWLLQNSDHYETGSNDTIPMVITGSHDPLLEWALRESDSPFALQTTGSLEGLKRFSLGKATVCGIHVIDLDSGDYNLAEVRKRFDNQAIVLIEWAVRQQGIIVAQGNPLEIKDLKTLQQTKARIIGRQNGAGGKLLFEYLLRKAGLKADELNILSFPARNETDIGMNIIENKADAGIGLAAVAHQLGLEYIPLCEEHFDLLIRHYDYFQPPFQSLLQFARSEMFVERSQQLSGYSLKNLGCVRFNITNPRLRNKEEA